MSRRHLAVVLTLLISVGAAVAGGGDLVLDAIRQRANDVGGTQVVPDNFLRRWDPVTVFYAGSRGRTGPEDRPDRLVQMTPEHPGAWTWLDERTLQFRPAEPWTPMSNVRIAADSKTHEVFTLADPPTRSEPRDGARNLSPVERVELEFADPLPAETLQRLTQIELRPLPGLSDDGLVTLDSDDFEVKALPRTSAQAPATYAYVLDTPIPRGLSVTMKVALSLDTEAREAVHTLRFRTAEPFRATQMGCANTQVPIAPSGSSYPVDRALTCTGSREARVSFNASPDSLGPIEGRNLVRFEPAVEGLEFESSGQTLRIRGNFRDEVGYTMHLVPTALMDKNGRPLEMTGESQATLRFERRAPFFKWGASQGIMERLGPKHVPIMGRGLGQVDLRVYEIDPLNRELWPFSKRPISVDESARPPGPGEEPPPLSETGTVSRQDLQRRLRLLGTPGYSALVDVGLEGAAARTGLDLDAALTQLGGRNGPGHYLVGVRRVDGPRTRDWMRLQVTDLALTTLETGDEVRFFVTSLSTGKPVPGARISVDGVVTSRGSSSWKTVIDGTTDSAGVYTFKAPGKGSVSVRRLSVKKGADVLVLDPKNAPKRFANGHWNSDNSAWLDWAFRSLDNRVERERQLGHVFTERPIYRPEEEVHIKGYLRTRYKGRLQPISGKVSIKMRAPDGSTIDREVTATRNGSFYLKWSQADAPSGTYTVQVRKDGTTLANTDFQMEAYRLPTFEVALDTPEHAEQLPGDVPFTVTANASYYAGGKVGLRPVAWKVTQFPFTWSPEGMEGFRYSSDSRYGAGRFESTPSLERVSQTDKNGLATLTLDPGIEPTAQPRTYVIEATVTGADEQTVTATHRVHAVPAFVLGLNVPRHLEEPESIPVRAVAVGPDSKAVSGQALTLRLIQRQWHSVLQASDFSDGVARYVTDTVDVPILERSFESGAEASAFDLPVDEPGVYIVELEGRDALGRSQLVTVDLFVGGSGDVSWTKPEQGVFEVSLDADSYKPGETAKLLVRSPFQNATALVVIERPRGNLYRTVAITGGKATVDVRIEKGWVPRIPVHVLLRRGRNRSAGVVGKNDLGKPETVGNTRWLKVEPVENTVDVGLSHVERAMPGETVDVTVTLKDPSGKPLSGEVTLWLVDQAVLALAKEKPLDPRGAFLPANRSRFSARDTRNLSFGTVPFSEMPGGDGGDEDEDADGLLDNVSVRKNFKSVPFYDPSIQVGASGRATVKVQLPDNLTVFKVRAKAVSGAERFGHAKSSVKVRLPVVVQADLPRFVRPGDALEVAALARVVEGSGGAGRAEVKVDGLTLQGDSRAALTWSEDEAVRMAWAVEVPTPELSSDGSLSESSVSVTIGAERTADGAGDAVQITLPVRDDRRMRTRRDVLSLAAGGAVGVERIGERARPGSLRREVLLSDHPGIVKMAAAMDVFVGRPAYSTGQAIDRARAWIGLGETREALGLEGKDLVDAAVAEGLGNIAAAVDGRGLVAAFPGGRGQVTLTADSLLLIEDAKAAGYSVDDKLRSQLIRTLKGSLRSDYRYFLDGSSAYERSHALEALATAGAYDESTFNELADNARTMGPLGQSNLLLAAARAGRSDSTQARTLTGRVEGEVIVGLYDGEERYRGLKSTGSPLSNLIGSNEAFVLASMTRGLGAGSPNSETLPHLVNALVDLGGEDGWGQRADGPALLALNDRLRGRSVESVSVDIGGESMTTSAGLVRIPLAGTGDVEVTHESGPDAVLLATSRWIPAEPGSKADATNEGFVIERSAAVYPGGAVTPSRVKLDEGGREIEVGLGDVVEEHVRFISPEDRTYVVVEIPLAAGMEGMNPNLATSGADARPSKRDTIAPTYRSVGDDAVRYFFERLPKGTHDVYFRTRGTTAGRFVQPPASAELLYDQDVYGGSPGAWVVVK